MYSTHHFDTPSPQSQFRRPWSPEPFDPYPPSPTNPERDTFLHHHHHHHQQQQPSDVSIEALDLADYAVNLNTSGTESRYPPFRRYDSYPSSPPPLRPLASLQTLSAGATTYTSTSRSPVQRPSSLPPPAHNSRTSLPDDPSSIGRLSTYPYLASPPSVHTTQGPAVVDSEIDISQFPPWSRNWYDIKGKYTPPSPYNDGLSHNNNLDPSKVSPFDPSQSYPNSELHSHSFHHPISDEPSRILLPWNGEPPSYGPPVDPEVKEERVRMLQREFGAKTKNKWSGKDEEEGEPPVIGSVDEKGRLVTQGPRKRIVVRVVEGLLALGCGISSIYAAVIIKPKSPPPPSGKLPAYVLYFLSVLTFFSILYLFVFHPCCSGRRSSRTNLRDGISGIPGMMVLPIQQRNGKKEKGGKKGKKGRPGGSVQVNLIVDPGMLQQDDRRDEYDQGEYDEHSSMPGTYAQTQSSPQRRTRPRRSIFASLAMEEQWRAARAFLKKLMFFDIVCVVVWGIEFVLILIGQRCPSGSFEGWCNAYNIASAGACLLIIAFGISVFFDIKDLHNSKASPRTRP